MTKPITPRDAAAAVVLFVVGQGHFETFDASGNRGAPQGSTIGA